MDADKKILVENELAGAIRAFHDIDNKEKREKYAKEYFINFCKENDIDLEEAYEIVLKIIDDRRKNSIFKYEHYENLKDILLGEER